MAWIKYCVGLLLFCFLSLVSCTQNERDFPEDDQHKWNPFYFKFQKDHERFVTKAGGFRVVPLFRKSSAIFPQLVHFELSHMFMRPNSLLVPHILNAHWFIYVQQGSIQFAWVQKGKLVEHKVEAGQLYHIPQGALVYANTSNTNQHAATINLMYNGNPPFMGRKHHQTSFLAGVYPPSALSGFRRDVLAAGLGVNITDVDKFFRQSRGPIISFQNGPCPNEQGNDEQDVEYERLRDIWPSLSKTHKKHKKDEEKSTKDEPFDLHNKKSDIKNDFGEYIFADQESFSPFENERVQNLGASITRIRKGNMTIPHWNSHAVRVAVVINGTGILQMSVQNISLNHDQRPDDEPQKPDYEPERPDEEPQRPDEGEEPQRPDEEPQRPDEGEEPQRPDEEPQRPDEGEEPQRPDEGDDEEYDRQDEDGQKDRGDEDVPQRQKQQRDNEEEDDEHKPEQDMSKEYYTVETNIRRGDVFVVPPDVMSVQIADNAEDLDIFSFLIGVEYDEMHTISGKNGDVFEIDDDILALALGVTREEIEEMFPERSKKKKKNMRELFTPGPFQQQQKDREQRRSRSSWSIV